MSFESVRALEIELDAALKQNDHDYAHQIRYNIMMWRLEDKGYGELYDLNETEPHKHCNRLEEFGAVWTFRKWLIRHGFEDEEVELYGNMTGQREDGWTIHDRYKFEEDPKLRILGFKVNADNIYVEVWYEDSKTGYILIDMQEVNAWDM